MGKLQRYFPLVSVSSRALSHATTEMHAVRKLYRDQIERPPKSGHLRGVDYYEPEDLRLAIAREADLFCKVHGVMPSLSDPKTCNEKLFWMKVFCDIPQPSPRNRLAVGNFIPEQVSHLVSAVKPIWLSDQICLPANEDVPAGDYFFKANYGSGYQQRITYPVSDAARRGMLSQVRRWPRRADVSGLGEWWYHTYPKEYFLEPSVSGTASPNEFRFTVLAGETGFIRHIGNRSESDQNNLYDRNFQPLNLNLVGAAQREFISAPQVFPVMRKVAEAIASQFKYARVDLFLLPDGELKLNQISLCPGSCDGVSDDPDLDRRFADMAEGLTFAG